MASSRVYVGGIGHRTREREIEAAFKRYGRVKDVSLKNGYAFVEFADSRDARDAVDDLDGANNGLLGDGRGYLKVQAATGTPHGRDQDRWGYRGHAASYRDHNRFRGRRSRSRSPLSTRPTQKKPKAVPRPELRLVVENLSSRVGWQVRSKR